MNNQEVSSLLDLLAKSKHFMHKHTDHPFKSLDNYDDAADKFAEYFEYVVHEASESEFSSLSASNKVFLAAFLGLYDYCDNQEDQQEKMPEADILKNINHAFSDVNAYLNSSSQSDLFKELYATGINFQPLLK